MIRIWDLEKKKVETILEGHEHCVDSIAITFDNKYIISGSRDKTFRIWKFVIKDITHN